jgi:uncharacterized SAM-binding protein YcdF (DUF218 family)
MGEQGPGHDTIATLLERPPEAIFVLSGNIVRKGNPGYPYASTAYADGDAHGLLGGKARVIAAAELARRLPRAAIVTTSRVDSRDAPVEGGRPTHARVMADELARLGVAPGRILLEEESTSTTTELIALIRMVAAHGWRDVAVVTSAYHVARARALFAALSPSVDPAAAPSRVAFIAAEGILPLRSRHYRALIARMARTRAYERRVASERAGIAALARGAYGRR